MWKDPSLKKLVKEVRREKRVLKTSSPHNTIELSFYPKSRKYVLWLNGYMQFISGLPEKEYHYKLYAVPVKLYFEQNRELPKSVLILGGGDGLGARELLKFKDIPEITLVDIDKTITDLAKNHPILKKLNRGALLSKRVKVINADAVKFLKNTSSQYDIIIVDFPDPDYDLMETNEFVRKNINPLYTCRTYKLIAKHLKDGGILSIQASGSPIVFNRLKNCLLKLGFLMLGKDRGINFEQYFLYAQKEEK